MITKHAIDTETVGLTGMPVLIQWASDGGSGWGDIKTMSCWRVPAREVVSLIEEFVDGCVIAHSVRFDWFMLTKLYHVCKQVPDQGHCLMDYPIWEVVEWETNVQRMDCLKPRAAVDTLQLAQKGKAQSAVMMSKPVYIRKVAKGLAPDVLQELEERTELPWILFAGRSDRDSSRWSICDRKDEDTGEIEEGWVDLKLSFNPSNGLKDMAEYLLGWESPDKFDEAGVPKEYWPKGEGYVPYVSLLTNHHKNWAYKDGFAWPHWVKTHIDHWDNSERAMDYARNDIKMLIGLYEYFGSPDNDPDAILACQVASVRLRGFAVNLDQMSMRLKESEEIYSTRELNVNSHVQVRNYIAETLDPMEQIIIARGCDSKIMDMLRLEFTLDEEEDCYCQAGKISNEDGSRYKKCERCGGSAKVGPGPMPVIDRVNHVEMMRGHSKRIELYNKILLARRAYPDFKVCGTKTGRMSGTSGLNFHGIVSAKEVRETFTFKDDHQWLSGGDFSSMEIGMMATTSNDDNLVQDIKKGLSLHALLAAELFDTTYEDIMENKDEDPLDRYGKAKSAIYLMAYGGSVETMADNLGLPLDVCKKGFDAFLDKYSNMKAARNAVKEQFTSLMHVPGAGFKLETVDNPVAETMFGYTRTFFNEYVIQKAIYMLLDNLPNRWKNLRVNVQRVEGKVQSISGSIYSALIGAAFSIQNAIIRAALNFAIQSGCRTITLGLQGKIWELQPQGIHPFVLSLMSIHDELVVVTEDEETSLRVAAVVNAKVNLQSEDIPLLALDWGEGLTSWSHVKSAKESNCLRLTPCGFGSEETV